MKTSRSLITLSALAAAVALGVSACGGGAAASAGNSSPLPADIKTVKIGVSDGGEPYWNVYKAEVKKKLGIDVEFTNFSDYNQPNPALAEGELQLNQFQHLQYLANSNVKQKHSLQPIGATAVYPLPLYSKKYKSLDEIPQGEQIAIPNDPVNQARSLGVLSQAGLVKLNTPISTTLTPANVDKAGSKVQVLAVDAKQTAQQLDNLAGGIVNNDYAAAANLSRDLILAKDDPNSDVAKPYINVFAVRAEDKDNETLRKLAEVYHEPVVEEAIRKDLGPNGVFKTNSAQELQDELASIETQLKAGK